jgi:putative FmdB family regulatory protein
MPIYEYRCSECHEEFEELTSMGGTAMTCRSCGSSRVTRLLSAFAVATSGPQRRTADEPGPCGACGARQRGMCEGE